MKKINYSLLLLSIIFALASSFSDAMNSCNQNPIPLKRSRHENSSKFPSKAESIAALDAALQTVDADGTTVLHAAAFAGDYKTCLQLLARGANPCTQNQNGDTALHYAVRANYPQVTQLLIDGMPIKAKRERIMNVLCILDKFRLPKDLRLPLLSYLPELVTAYPQLCNALIPHYISFKQLETACYMPQMQLLMLKNISGLTAYDIAKTTRNRLVARMTNPRNRAAICQEELNEVLHGTAYTEHKENNQ